MNEDVAQVAGPFTGFDNNTLYLEEICLEPGCYTIWMEDSYGDGWQGGNITFYDENGNILAIGMARFFQQMLMVTKGH